MKQINKRNSRDLVPENTRMLPVSSWTRLGQAER